MLKHISLFLYWLNGGGIPRVMVNLANGFSKKGYRVDFVLGKAEGSYLKHVSNNINIINLNVSRGFKCIPGLVRYLKRENPQILFTANTHLNISAIIAYILANVGNTKIVVSEHADFYKAQENRSFPLNYLNLAMAKMFYPKADKVVAVSRGVADSIKIAYRLDDSKILTIWNPVITDELYIQAMKPVKHPWLNKDFPIIISTGRLTKQKNYPLLLKAFSRVKEKIDAKLIILGEGEDREKLEGLIRKLGLEKDVGMPGFVDNPYCYLKKADLFVLSSLCEGFAMVLIEALACDTKVISTDCPYGPKEILEYAGTGRLIPTDNEEALTDAILEELDNDFVKPNLDAFKRDKIVDSYIKLFNDIL
jgi:glycosyltransferase involved in cell wall biosynthesis